MPQAVGPTNEPLETWPPLFAAIELLPPSRGGFGVTLDDELNFSKAAPGRHAAPGEVAARVRRRIGPGRGD